MFDFFFFVKNNYKTILIFLFNKKLIKLIAIVYNYNIKVFL